MSLLAGKVQSRRKSRKLRLDVALFRSRLIGLRDQSGALHKAAREANQTTLSSGLLLLSPLRRLSDVKMPATSASAPIKLSLPLVSLLDCPDHDILSPLCEA